MNGYTDDIITSLNELTDPQLDPACAVPDRRRIVEILKAAQVLLFPAFYHYEGMSQRIALAFLHDHLCDEILRTAELTGNCGNAQEQTNAFIQCLPQIKKVLLTDIEAIYNGDPAAISKAEVILCYPGFYAITIFRIAHELYRLGIPYIPRIMTEYAHEKTGIDINPGASIGEYFCIDHGTGIVIGETAVLGHHVKLYQGVTIGAKSFELDENGFPVKGGKRHPDIGNHVTIYANATILGGTTIIGDHSVIGGNVWLTSSVEEGTTVSYENTASRRKRHEEEE